MCSEVVILVRTLNIYRSEGFPRTGYFIPGRDGIGVWQDSRIVVTADSGQVAGPFKKDYIVSAT